ncbi:hypothetical protein D3C84_1214860 [compost metagenome]
MFFEALDGFTSLGMLHGTIDQLYLAGPIEISQGLAQIVLSSTVFGKDQHFLVGIGCMDLADDVFDEQP